MTKRLYTRRKKELPDMTKEFFLGNYFKLKSLEAVCGEMPEVEELLIEAKNDGLDTDKLLEHYKQPPDALLWI